MRCLKCGYELRRLPEPICPECGRAFDPNDPSTFASPARRRRRSTASHVIAFLVPVSLFWIGMITLNLAVQFGHWDAVPLIALPMVLVPTVACLYFATRFALEAVQGRVAFAVSVLLWWSLSWAIGWIGFQLIDLIPFTIGDGP